MKALKAIVIGGLALIGISVYRQYGTIGTTVEGIKITPSRIGKISYSRGQISSNVDLEIVSTKQHPPINLKLLQARIIKNGQVIAQTPINAQAKVHITAFSNQTVRQIPFFINANTLAQNLDGILNREPLQADILVEINGLQVAVPFTLNF